jgi:hypothetical protein
MYGLGCSSRISNHSWTFFSSTLGANGRKDSRNLILRFMTSCISRERASPRMLRLPRARGPNSIRPWYHPTTCCVSISPATRSISSPSSPIVS